MAIFIILIKFAQSRNQATIKKGKIPKVSAYINIFACVSLKNPTKQINKNKTKQQQQQTNKQK